MKDDIVPKKEEEEEEVVEEEPLGCAEEEPLGVFFFSKRVLQAVLTTKILHTVTISSRLIL